MCVCVSISNIAFGLLRVCLRERESVCMHPYRISHLACSVYICMCECVCVYINIKNRMWPALCMFVCVCVSVCARPSEHSFLATAQLIQCTIDVCHMMIIYLPLTDNEGCERLHEERREGGGWVGSGCTHGRR